MNQMLPILLLLVIAIAACSGERADIGNTAGSAAVAPATTDQPPLDMAPTPAPPSTPHSTALPAAGPMPADGAIGYAGFGPARFGADEEAVRMAWGKDIKADTPAEPGGCYYLFPQSRRQTGYGIGFMIEGGRFARIDVDSADIAAPGGGRVGMGVDEIRARYRGRIEERGHKYVEGGKYLRIIDSAGGNGVLLFATDAIGKVTAWRIGVPPQVDYVEACS